MTSSALFDSGKRAVVTHLQVTHSAEALKVEGCSFFCSFQGHERSCTSVLDQIAIYFLLGRRGITCLLTNVWPSTLMLGGCPRSGKFVFDGFPVLFLGGTL